MTARDKMGPRPSWSGAPLRLNRPLLLVLLATLTIQLIYTSLKPTAIRRVGEDETASEECVDNHSSGSLNPLSGPRWQSESSGPFGVLLVEAKKKKKEKSEVVVISVQNPPAKGYGGGMYPIYVPSCGGGAGHGGFGGGYGRRKRSAGYI